MDIIPGLVGGCSKINFSVKIKYTKSKNKMFI
jgi:hypothetical protein